jgi:glycosyltransferase involved in cell wall biosynthesis
MRVLVNALSIGSLSGQHVVYGFLSKLAEWTCSEHEFLILRDETSKLPESLIRENVTSLAVSRHLRNWIFRIPWEIAQLPRIARSQSIDVLLNPSGAKLPRMPCPQVVLAQNPWCFVPQVHRNAKDRFKALLQRRGYRSAFRSSDLMLFISDHLRSLYRQDAGPGREAPSEIAHVGLDGSTYAAAEKFRGDVVRDPHLIVSVSAMARWKGAETLVAAVKLLRDGGLPARLRLVGPWPDPAYEQEIRRQIDDLDLADAVAIAGKVTKGELHRHYAEARVFCLMSHCESFGIPAAEAQAFGTPVVASTGCAIPEVCGLGGLYGPPDDPHWTASALSTMLTSESTWRTYSQAALENAQKLRWDLTTRPFLSIFSLGQTAPTKPTAAHARA